MKNDFNIATSTGASSTLVTTEMTSGVIVGYKTRSSTIAPIDAVSCLNGTDDTVQNLINRISALERIQPSQIYKVENCPNCGGTMKLYADDHILKCQYCKSVVFVGIKNING